MPDLREIKTRIKSIRDTRQITNAMYMISSSKVRKARASLENTVPYFEALGDAIASILRRIPDIENVYFHNLNKKYNDVERRGYIIITADKGLAGAYNLNVLKSVSAHLSDNVKSKLYVVGEVGRRFFQNKGADIAEDFNFSANDPTLSRARRITEYVVDLYERGKLDEIYIIYTRLEGAVCETVMEKLLPLHRYTFKTLNEEVFANEGEMQFYPSADSVISTIVPNYLAGYVYGALIESFCSEQNSRMTAMQGANETANEMLHSLAVEYNRARQTAITQEINEIMGGAKLLRVKNKEGQI